MERAKKFASTLIIFVQKLERNFQVMLAAIGLHQNSRLLTETSYDPLYAVALGANPVELGMLRSIGGAVTSIVSAPVGWLCDKYGVKKMITIGITLSILVPTIYLLSGSWWMIIPAIILFNVMNSIITPFTDTIFIGYLKPEDRAMGIGFTRVIWGIPRIFMPMIAAFIVTRFGGISIEGIRPLYCVQIAVYCGVFLLVITQLKGIKVGEGLKSGFFRDLREVCRGGALKRFILLWCLQQFFLKMPLPFITLFAVEIKGATPLIIGVWGTASTLVSMLFSIPLGMLADKHGRKKMIYLLRPFAYLRYILLVLSPRPEWLIVFGVLEGMDNASTLIFITMMWEMVPSERRGRWFGILTTFSIINVPAPMIGGLLWQHGAPAFIFSLPIILDVVITLPILTTIPETLKPLLPN